MTFEEWYGIGGGAIAVNTLMPYTYRNAARLVWQAATAAERERCTKIAEGWQMHSGVFVWDISKEIATAIRKQERP